MKKIEIHKIAELAAKGARVLVGFPSGLQHYSGKDISELARQLSVGDAHMPARPFLIDGILSKKDDIRAEIKKQAENLVKTGKANYNKVGTKAVGAVQDFVRSGAYKTSAPNAEYTIRMKSKRKSKKKVIVSDIPLIDTGELINSVHYAIVSGNKVINLVQPKAKK